MSVPAKLIWTPSIPQNEGADYEDYIKGREERLKDTLLGKGIGALQGMFNPVGSALQGAQTLIYKFLLTKI